MSLVDLSGLPHRGQYEESVRIVERGAKDPACRVPGTQFRLDHFVLLFIQIFGKSATEADKARMLHGYRLETLGPGRSVNAFGGVGEC